MFSPIRYVQTGNGKIERIATIAIIPTIKHKNITDNEVQIHVSKILKNEEKNCRITNYSDISNFIFRL